MQVLIIFVILDNACKDALKRKMNKSKYFSKCLGNEEQTSKNVSCEPFYIDGTDIATH